MTEYKVYFADKTVGNVAVERHGLYYQFSCTCRLPTDELYDLAVMCEGNMTILGLCIPSKSGFGIRTRQPVKHIGTGEMHFQLYLRKPELPEQTVKVSEDEPFEYLARLTDARFVIQDGQPNIVFQSSKEISSPTGQ